MEDNIKMEFNEQ